MSKEFLSGGDYQVKQSSEEADLEAGGFVDKLKPYLKDVRRFSDELYERLNPDFKESNYEHTIKMLDLWSKFKVACPLFFDELRLNSEKVSGMIGVHDLAEFKTGDWTRRRMQVEKRTIEKKETVEREAISQLCREMKTDDPYLADKVEELWKEYQKRECLESRLVKAFDNISGDQTLLGEFFLMGNDSLSVTDLAELKKDIETDSLPKNIKIASRIFNSQKVREASAEAREELAIYLNKELIDPIQNKLREIDRYFYQQRSMWQEEKE